MKKFTLFRAVLAAAFPKTRHFVAAKLAAKTTTTAFKATLLAATLAFSTLLPSKIHANNAIAIIVDNEPITIYELNKAMRVLNLSKEEAKEVLINERLQDAQIKKMGSLVDDFELENEIKRSAGGTDEGLAKLKAELAGSGLTYDAFKKDFKKQMERQRLYEAIANSAKVDYSEDGARSYYEQHKDEFVVYASVSVRLYSGSDEGVLENFRQNAQRIAAMSESGATSGVAGSALNSVNSARSASGGFGGANSANSVNFTNSASLKAAQKALKNAIPSGVSTQNEVLTVNNADPRLLVFLSRFEPHQFSPVIEDGVGGFVLYEVLSKSAPQQLAYEQIAEQVGQIYVSKQRQDYIKDFFDKQLAKANIKELR